MGENNAGKSNFLKAVQCFLSAGAGGMAPDDFTDQNERAFIECEFDELSQAEKAQLKSYLVNDRIILRKELFIVEDEEKQKRTVKSEYHGYHAEPTLQHLSMKKIENAFGARPNWKKIAEDNAILDYVTDKDGKITKASYKAGIEKYAEENEIEYDQPVLGQTHALGIPTNLLSKLPAFYLLPGITDYSTEIDKRSSSTVFRRLMGDLSDRILSADPRYSEIEAALNTLKSLLNTTDDTPRLTALGDVEISLRDTIRKLMPDVRSISLGVEVDVPKEIFSRGVSIKIDDGVLTDVLDKGHGMQRNLIFSLLQLLMNTAKTGAAANRPIILGIEEPELYIHPHCQRLIFRVLKEFVGATIDGTYQGADQILYTTHSPSFVEVWNYERITVVRKLTPEAGSKVHQAAKGILGNPDDEKVFKILTSFSLKHNEIFFAREIVLVEGPEDECGVIAAARKLNRIQDLPDEIGLSIVATGSKGEMPKFQKVMNAFGIKYGALFEADGHDDDHKQNAPILSALNGNRVGKIPNKLETLFGRGHFADQRAAKEFFSDVNNINQDWEQIVTALLPPP